jgi:hypothetical protein
MKETLHRAQTYKKKSFWLVVLSLGALEVLVGSYFTNSSSSFSSLYSSSIGDLVLSPMVDWEHSTLYLSGFICYFIFIFQLAKYIKLGIFVNFNV